MKSWESDSTQLDWTKKSDPTELNRNNFHNPIKEKHKKLSTSNQHI